MGKRSGRRHSRNGAHQVPTPGLSLAPGWDSRRVQQRYLRYAQPLVARGITWRGLEQPQDQASAERLVQAHVAGSQSWKIDPSSGGVIAEDAQGSVIAAAVVGAVAFPNARLGVFIQHLVVEPAWRGQGVGVVTLGVVRQIAGDPPNAVYLGNCAAADAAFYQRAGYTVLHPGDIFPARVLLGAAADLACTSAHYPCWFYK